MFGLLVAFVAVAQRIYRSGLDPFANDIVRILLIPGYLITFGYAILRINLLPEMGFAGWLVGLGVYLYLLSAVIAGTYHLVSAFLSR